MPAFFIPAETDGPRRDDEAHSGKRKAELDLIL
jgi:hypothetical protein